MKSVCMLSRALYAVIQALSNAQITGACCYVGKQGARMQAARRAGRTWSSLQATLFAAGRNSFSRTVTAFCANRP